MGKKPTLLQILAKCSFNYCDRVEIAQLNRNGRYNQEWDVSYFASLLSISGWEIKLALLFASINLKSDAVVDNFCGWAKI